MAKNPLDIYIAGATEDAIAAKIAADPENAEAWRAWYVELQAATGSVFGGPGGRSPGFRKAGIARPDQENDG